MDIYIKPVKKAAIAERRNIQLRDIAEVFAPNEQLGRLKCVKILDINSQKKSNYLVSIIDIIAAVNAEFPGSTIVNVGEQEVLIDYNPQKTRDNKLYKSFKIALISVIIFMGAATAIMSFHSDAQIPEVFRNMFKLFLGEENDNPLIIEIPYSIGLALGIIVFFNHFMGKKITDDPTPIEVEISVYEADVTDTKLDMLNTERIKGGGGS